jgi:hypothetical protein
MKNIFHTLIKPIIAVSIALKLSAFFTIVFSATISLLFSIITPATFMGALYSTPMIIISVFVFVFSIVWALVELGFSK